MQQMLHSWRRRGSSQHPLQFWRSLRCPARSWWLLIPCPAHITPSCARRYQALDPSLLPPLWLMVSDDPSDSGAMHSTVRQRWRAGDAGLRRDMAAVAELAELGR